MLPVVSGKLEDALTLLARLDMQRVAEALKEERMEAKQHYSDDDDDSDDDNNNDSNPCASLRLTCRAGRQLVNIAVTEIKVRWLGAGGAIDAHCKTARSGIGLCTNQLP